MVGDILGGLILTIAFIGVLCLGEAAGHINFKVADNAEKKVYFDGVECDHVMKNGLVVSDGCWNLNHATDEYIPVQMDEVWARQEYACQKEACKSVLVNN